MLHQSDVPPAMTERTSYFDSFVLMLFRTLSFAFAFPILTGRLLPISPSDEIDRLCGGDERSEHELQ